MLTKDLAVAVLDAQKAAKQADKAYSDAVVAQDTAGKALSVALKALRDAIAADSLKEDVAYTLNASTLAVVRVDRGIVLKIEVRT